MKRILNKEVINSEMENELKSAELPEHAGNLKHQIKLEKLDELISTPNDLVLDFSKGDSPELYYSLGKLIGISGMKLYFNVIGLENDEVKSFVNSLFHYITHIDELAEIATDEEKKKSLDTIVLDILSAWNGEPTNVFLKLNPEDPRTVVYFGLLSNLKLQNNVYTKSDEPLPEEYDVILRKSNKHMVGDEELIDGTNLFDK